MTLFFLMPSTGRLIIAGFILTLNMFRLFFQIFLAKTEKNALFQQNILLRKAKSIVSLLAALIVILKRKKNILMPAAAKFPR